MKEIHGYSVYNTNEYNFDSKKAFTADIVHDNGTIIKNRYNLCVNELWQITQKDLHGPINLYIPIKETNNYFYLLIR